MILPVAGRQVSSRTMALYMQVKVIKNFIIFTFHYISNKITLYLLTLAYSYILYSYIQKIKMLFVRLIVVWLCDVPYIQLMYQIIIRTNTLYSVSLSDERILRYCNIL